MRVYFMRVIVMQLEAYFDVIWRFYLHKVLEYECGTSKYNRLECKLHSV